MNVQTKTTVIAASMTFALMLISAIGTAISDGYVEPLDTLNPTNPEVIGHWVGYLGGVPLIVALIVVAGTGRKAGLRSSLLNGIGAIIVIPLVLLPLVIATAAAFSTDDWHPFAADGVGRRLFVKDTKHACAGKLKKQDVSPAFADILCSCYAKSIADVSTRMEILGFNIMPMRDKAAAIGENCRRIAQGDAQR
jgi:amino acid transporter